MRQQDAWRVGIIIGTISLGTLSPVGTAQPIFVRHDAPVEGDGSSWRDAFRHLQDAIDLASPGDEIWVAAGTYFPDLDEGCASCENDRTLAFELHSGVRLLGGFAGIEMLPEQRDPVCNETVLSGDLLQDDDPRDPFANNADNSHHVVNADFQIDTTALIDGFSILGGNADETSSQRGGGLRSFQSSPAIVRCRFETNSCSFNGGGLVLVANFFSDPVKEPFSVVNCSFIGNIAGGMGGGVSQVFSQSVTYVNCLFADNDAGDIGGGAAIGESGVSATLFNCTFAGNQALSAGGAVGIDHELGSVDILNCVLWGDAPDEIVAFSEATNRVSFSDVQGGFPIVNVVDLGGNIDQDPGFAGGGDYQITSESPCVDVGDAASVPQDRFDVDQDGDFAEKTPDLKLERRVVAQVIDMGAFEFSCRGDSTDDHVVGFEDVLAVLAAWGDICAPPTGCLEDLDTSGAVGFGDLLAVLVDWGCGEPNPAPLVDQLTCMGLSQADWNSFVYVMEHGTAAQQDNYICWMDHYWNRHCLATCLCAPTCPGTDPFGRHPSP